MPDPPPVQPADLAADCARCFALCCVVLRLDASAGFGFDKPAGRPCRHLASDLRCGIHAELRAEGFAGCAVYDCQGAGQKVSQVTLGGRDWRGDPRTLPGIVAVYPVVRQLHEVLAHLVEAQALLEAQELPGASRLRPRVDDLVAHLNELTYLPAEAVMKVDVPAERRPAAALLDEVSALARRPLPRRSWRNADLVGAPMRGRDLRRADLRGAYLIATDLRDADLRGADLLGADLRDADVRGADLTGCLFLTKAQLQAARGDATTRLPVGHERPTHWDASE